MPKYFHKDDPGLLSARQEHAWYSFLEALAQFTPEILDGLKGKPFRAFRKVANQYKKVSPYRFGAALYPVDAPRHFNPRPLGNLALLICAPDSNIRWNDWPPSAAFREPAMQECVSKLSVVMKAWAAKFRSISGGAPPMLINAGLQTMHDWQVKPGLMASNVWVGHVRLSGRRSIPTPQYCIEGWNATSETEKQFNVRSKRGVDDLKRLIKAHVREMKRLLAKADIKRNPAHFQWAALRIARRLTYSKIATLCGDEKMGDLDEDTVRKGVKAALDILGLRDVTTSRR